MNKALTRRGFLRKAAVGASALAVGGVLAGCSGLEGMLRGQHTVTDSLGRPVTMPVPTALKRIYFTSPLAQTFCFTLAPDLLAGTALMFTRDQLDFLPEGSADLPYLGSLADGGSIDVEALLERDVQVIFSISGVGITDVNVADAVALQEASGIPVFLVDGSLDRISDSYRLLGSVLGREKRAEELAGFCETVYAEVTEAVAGIPKDERIRYYFAEGPDGLVTETDDSQHIVAFNEAGGVNVAAGLPPAPTAVGLVDVSMEQVQEWDPDVIIAWDWATRGGAADLIRATEAWQDIQAVREGRVYAMPSLPFPFCDRPPGINRVLGMQWLANLFYPERYAIDMAEAVRTFYRTCYWRDITRVQAEHILGQE